MIFEEIKNIKADKKDLRRYGITVGLVFAFIGLLFLWRGKAFYFYFILFAFFFLASGLLFPVILRPIHKVWMTVALLLGWFWTRVLLIILFYLIVTPIELLLRLFGKRFLDLKIDKNKESYWINREQTSLDKSMYEKQF